MNIYNEEEAEDDEVKENVVGKLEEDEYGEGNLEKKKLKKWNMIMKMKKKILLFLFMKKYQKKKVQTFDIINAI